MPDHRLMSIEWAKPVANEALSLQNCNVLRGGAKYGVQKYILHITHAETCTRATELTLTATLFYVLRLILTHMIKNDGS